MANKDSSFHTVKLDLIIWMGGNIVCGFGGDLIEVHIFINEIVYNYERLLGILCKTFIEQFALFIFQFEKNIF